MKRMFTVIVLFLWVSIAGQSQVTDPAWKKNYGGTNLDQAYKIRPVPGNGFISAGITRSVDGDLDSTEARGTDIWVVKTDITGNMQWDKKIGGTGDEACWALEVTADGGYILAGSTKSGDGDATGSGWHSLNDAPDFWVVKLDSAGNIEWQRALGGDGEEIATGVAQTDDDGDGQKDDGYVVIGYTTSANGDVTGIHSVHSDVWVVKLNAAGTTIEWQKCLGGSQTEFGRDIKQTPDGGYIVLADTYSDDGDVTGYHQVSDSHIYSDWWVAKLNASGTTIEWQKCFGGTYAEVPFEIALTDDDNDGVKDDGYIIAGNTESIDGDVPLPAYGSYDMWVMKLNVAGQMQWQQRLGGSINDRGRSVQQTKDGGYIVLGTASTNDGNLAGTHHNGKHDFLLVKFNASGNITWKKMFGGDGYDEGWSVVQGADGCYVLAGGSTSNNSGDVGSNYGDFDFWILNWCAPVAGSLPVKLEYFKARYLEAQTVALEWKTAGEQNNDRFEIQRSIDGNKFETIATVKGAGTSFHAARYIYTDEGISSLGAGTIYYRLRQVDFDGKAEISPVATIKIEALKSGNVKIWPNPGKGVFNLQLGTTPLKPVTATVYNASGQVIMTRHFQTAQHSIDLTGRNKGTYFIRIDDNKGFMQMQQVLLQ